MNSIIKLSILLVILAGLEDKTNCLSCQLTGRFGCLASCQIQNCATGYCRADDTCVCSRCSSGGLYGKRSDINSIKPKESFSTTILPTVTTTAPITHDLPFNTYPLNDVLLKGNSCSYAGLAGCVSSCAAQGRYCGGYCKKPSNTCICYRC